MDLKQKEELDIWSREDIQEEGSGGPVELRGQNRGRNRRFGGTERRKQKEKLEIWWSSEEKTEGGRGDLVELKGENRGRNWISGGAERKK